MIGFGLFLSFVLRSFIFVLFFPINSSLYLIIFFVNYLWIWYILTQNHFIQQNSTKPNIILPCVLEVVYLNMIGGTKWTMKIQKKCSDMNTYVAKYGTKHIPKSRNFSTFIKYLWQFFHKMHALYFHDTLATLKWNMVSKIVIFKLESLW